MFQNLKFVKRDSFAPEFMTWVGESFHGKTDIRVIDKGVKVNSDFYIKKVLKHFVNTNGDQIKDMVFHQDSTSSHISKHTLAYKKLRKQKKISLYLLKNGYPKVLMHHLWILLFWVC